MHQLGHQWGDESRLAAVAGAPSTGLEQDRHTPLLFPGGTLVEAVLDATRTVERLDSGLVGQVADYRIAGALSPFRFYPLQLYRMGVLAPKLVPDGTLFVNQGQFGSMTAPAIGTTVNGDRRTLTMNDIRAELGVRNGPNLSEW